MTGNAESGVDTLPRPAEPTDSVDREYVTLLFQHVLGRKRTDPGEISYWTDYLSRNGDPMDVFRRFVGSEEYRARARRLARETMAYPPGHFYSPVVDVDEAAADRERIFGPRALHGVDLRPATQEKLFRALVTFFPSLPFIDEPGGAHRYHYDNSSYGFGDACIYWALLGLTRPARILEVGSGYTSALALDAIDRFGLDTTCTFVDPHPDLLLRVTEPRAPRHVVISEPIQSVGANLAAALRANDLLFIDSSHVVKTGSDVAYEITEMLPRLARGVIVHFHDVFYPFEYPERWVLAENKSWNELYVLHAFLMFNSGFEVLFFNDFFAKTRRDLVMELAGALGPRFLLNSGGGLWLRRI